MRRGSHIRWMGLGLVLVFVLAVPAGAWAQVATWPELSALKGMDLTELAGGWQVPEVAPVHAAVPRTFGLVDEVAYVIPASEFEVTLFTDAWGTFAPPPPTAGLFRIPGAAAITLFAGLRLPAGALITRVELDGVDLDAVGQITSLLFSATSPAGATPIKLLAGMGTGGAATPGPGLFPFVFAGGLTPADLTIDNAGHYYIILVGLSPTAVGFSNVRVFYKLQVSPAPAVATFGDVPTTSSIFKFVEALVASGITAGCGGGNYCPDAPLTRGQMAVFLSTALGLHFAP